MTTNAILETQALEAMIRPQFNTNPSIKMQPSPNAGDDPRWNAVVARDASRDGEFVFALSSTGIYCRPSFPARRPRPATVHFFSAPAQHALGGSRACLRCL